MWARLARFEGDPGDIDARVQKLRAALDSGDLPFELDGAKFLLFVAELLTGRLLLLRQRRLDGLGDGLGNARP